MGGARPYYRRNKAIASREERRYRLYKLLRVITSFGIICSLSYLIVRGHHFAATDDFFKIADIRFIGNKQTDPEELASLMKLPEGANIFRASIRLLQKRITSHPWIKRAVIRRELPNSLVIYIEERMPAAIAEYKNRHYLIDKNGVVLGRSGVHLEKKVFPVITGVDFSGIRFGEELPPEGLVEALKLLDILKGKNELAMSENIGIEIKKGLLILKLDGYTVNMGRNDYDKKLSRFAEVRQDMQEKGIDSKKIDMRFNNKVVIKN